MHLMSEVPIGSTKQIMMCTCDLSTQLQQTDVYIKQHNLTCEILTDRTSSKRLLDPIPVFFSKLLKRKTCNTSFPAARANDEVEDASSPGDKHTDEKPDPAARGDGADEDCEYSEATTGLPCVVISSSMPRYLL